MGTKKHPHVLIAKAEPLQNRPIIGVSKRLFADLILERTSEFKAINRLENIFVGVLPLVAIGALLTLFWRLSQLFPAPIAQFDAAVRDLSFYGEAWPDASRALGVVLAVGLGYTVASRLSAQFIDFVASWSISQRKYMRGDAGRLDLIEKIEQILRFEPGRILENYRELRAKRPAIFRASIEKSLAKLRDPKAGVCAVVIERFVERKPWGLYLRDWFKGRRTAYEDGPMTYGRYFRRARVLRNDIKVSLMYQELACELRDETPDGERWRRNYYSEKNAQLTALKDSCDLHLRFRSGTPHLRWPSSRPSSRNEVALYRTFVCVENPVRQPIFVLAVRDVIDMIPVVVEAFFDDCKGNDPGAVSRRQATVADVIFKLTDNELEMFDKWDLRSLNYDGEAATKRDAILKAEGVELKLQDVIDNVDDLHRFDWRLRWDPNYTNWIELAQEKERTIGRAFAVLIEAINMAANTKAAEIDLKRGDAVVVDNTRCLVARRETQGIDWWKQAAVFPEEWYLHGYYGFRRSRRIAGAPDAADYDGGADPAETTLSDEEMRDGAGAEKTAAAIDFPLRRAAPGPV